MKLFKKKNYIRMNPPEAVSVAEAETPSIPDGLWIKCKNCDKTIYTKELNEYKICHIGRASCRERVLLKV